MGDEQQYLEAPKLIGDSEYSEAWHRRRLVSQGGDWQILVKALRSGDRISREGIVHAVNALVAELQDSEEVTRSTIRDNQKLRGALREIVKLDTHVSASFRANLKTARRLALIALGETPREHPEQEAEAPDKAHFQKQPIARAYRSAVKEPEPETKEREEA
jgi:hypothetical protein